MIFGAKIQRTLIFKENETFWGLFKHCDVLSEKNPYELPVSALKEVSRLLKLLRFSRFSVSPGNKQIAQLGLVDENRQGHFQSKGGKRT